MTRLQPLPRFAWQLCEAEFLPFAGTGLRFESVRVLERGAGGRAEARLLRLGELPPELLTQAEAFACPPPPFAGLGKRDGAAPLRPLLMGVLNLTPDSFHRSSRADPRAGALSLKARAEALLEGGADILDLGAESTRPGARPVEEAEERARLAPALEAVAELRAERAGRGCAPFALSVDTRKPDLFSFAAENGADILNDVGGFAAPGAWEAAAESGLALLCMHAQGGPEEMQQDPRYRDPVLDLCDWFEERLEAAAAAGVPRERIALDPGFGFGKSTAHNLALLAGLPAFLAFCVPVAVGLSRKSWVAALDARALADAPEGRLAGSLAGALAAALGGASILRVHDPAEHAQALAVFAALADARGPAGRADAAAGAGEAIAPLLS